MKPKGHLEAHITRDYNKIIKGWFSEICPMWPGISLSLEIESCLYSTQSKFQTIELFQTRHYGKMLALDGIIQLTESDEFAYQEMLAHVPLFSHPDPEKVLIIGDGDGGILRETARHGGIKTIDLCEIDEQVIHVSQRFLPQLAYGFEDSRISVHIEEGRNFIQRKKNEYDVIMVDSSDPVEPGTALFERPFYEGIKSALKANGIMAVQGESFFPNNSVVTNMMALAKELYPVQAYSYFLVPTYIGGHIGICLGSLGPDVTRPNRGVTQSFQNQLYYYTPRLHEASCVLPEFVNRMFKQGRTLERSGSSRNRYQAH